MLEFACTFECSWSVSHEETSREMEIHPLLNATSNNLSAHLLAWTCSETVRWVSLRVLELPERTVRWVTHTEVCEELEQFEYDSLQTCVPLWLPLQPQSC